MEPIIAIVFLLLIGGVAGSIIPMMPGGILSATGIVVYFLGTSDPSTLFVIFGLITAIFTLVVDWFAGSLAAKYGGASTKTSIASGIAGLIGFIITFGNPLGLLAGVAITVFAREYMMHGDEKKGIKASFYATIGVLGSSIAQVLLTASILIGFLITILV